MLKGLIEFVAARGLSNIVYFSFHLLDFVSVCILALYTASKIKITKVKAMLIVLIVYPLIYAWMLVQFWIESGFKSFGGQHMVSMFIWIPLAGILASKILKIEWKTVCFFLAPCVPLVQTVGHIGCIFLGCCQGYPAEWGLYNLRLRQNLFPIQPIESLIAASIVVFLLFRAKKQKYIPDAKHYPIMMILFGSTRFICEFFRDNEKLLWGCSKLSFHALFMVLVGVIALIIIKKRNDKQNGDMVKP